MDGIKQKKFEMIAGGVFFLVCLFTFIGGVVIKKQVHFNMVNLVSFIFDDLENHFEKNHQFKLSEISDSLKGLVPIDESLSVQKRLNEARCRLETAFAMNGLFFPLHNSRTCQSLVHSKCSTVSPVLRSETHIKSFVESLNKNIIWYSFFLNIIFLSFLGAVYCLYKSIASKNKYLKQINEEIVMVSNYEQSKISQYLHDGIGQLLSGINFLIGSIKNRRVSSKQYMALIEQIQGIVLKSMGEIKYLSKNMAFFENRGRRLETCLQTLIETTQNQYNINIHTQIDWSILESMSNRESNELYFVIFESISNAIRHGHAKNIDLHIGKFYGARRVKVEDDGKKTYTTDLGFPEGSGLGLKIMAYRCERIFWRFEASETLDGFLTQAIEVC